MERLDSHCCVDISAVCNTATGAPITDTNASVAYIIWNVLVGQSVEPSLDGALSDSDFVKTSYILLTEIWVMSQ